MSEKTSVVLFGHSFPARLARQARKAGVDAETFIGLSDRFTIFVEGHPGLTFSRIFGSSADYLSKLRSNVIDILVIDLGTNDLCNQADSAEVVVQKAVQFLDLLKSNSVVPKRTVFLSVIQRSAISRPVHFATWPSLMLSLQSSS